MLEIITNVYESIIFYLVVIEYFLYFLAGLIFIIFLKFSTNYIKKIILFVSSFSKEKAKSYLISIAKYIFISLICVLIGKLLITFL
jgi:hypothetical protein